MFLLIKIKLIVMSSMLVWTLASWSTWPVMSESLFTQPVITSAYSWKKATKGGFIPHH